MIENWKKFPKMVPAVCHNMHYSGKLILKIDLGGDVWDYEIGEYVVRNGNGSFRDKNGLQIEAFRVLEFAELD